MSYLHCTAFKRFLPALLLLATGLARAQNAGSDDPSWTVPTPSSTFSNAYWTAIAALPDGKVLARGPNDSGSAAVFRFNRNGTPDSTFSTNGAGASTMQQMHVDASGRIYLIGTVTNSTYQFGFANIHSEEIQALRLRPDGTRDTSYGTDGWVTLPLTDDRRETWAERNFQSMGKLQFVHSTLQPDGKLLLMAFGLALGGEVRNPNGLYFTLVIVRLDTNGRPDPGFGSGGLALFHLKDGDGITGFGGRALAALRDGSVVVAGYGFIGKLTAQGMLDTSFGTNGRLSPNTATAEHRFMEIAEDVEGRIVVGGSRCVEGTWVDCEPLVARLNANGTPDASFGSGGSVLLNLSAAHEQLEELAIDGNGNIIVAGNLYIPRVVPPNQIDQYDYEPFLAGIGPAGELDFARTDIVAPAQIRGGNPIAPHVELSLAEGAYLLTHEPDSIRKFVLDPAPRGAGLSSQQEPTNSGFRIDARDSSGAVVDTAPQSWTLGLYGYIYPQRADVGDAADIFIAAATPRGWYLRNSAGNFVPWSARIAELTPALTNVILTATTPVSIYAGQLPWAGTYRLYLGYRLTGDTDVIYMEEAALLEITP